MKVCELVRNLAANLYTTAGRREHQFTKHGQLILLPSFSFRVIFKD